MDFGIAGVAGITAVCYLVGMLVKATKLDNKWIPIVVGTAGCVLGVLGFFVVPGFPADDFLTAAAVGIASGLSATGVHQAAKQIQEVPNE